MFNRFPASSEQRQCSNNVSPLRQERGTPVDFPIAPGCCITQKSKETRHSRDRAARRQQELGPPDVSRGTPRRGAHAVPLSLRPHLPFPHSGGPGRRKPGHGKGWCGRPGGTQGRTDSGLRWAPRPVTSLGVYKALGIIVRFWQKAMEPKSLRMAFKEKTSLRIPSAPASAPSEMQTPGHPWLCPQPTSSRERLCLLFSVHDEPAYSGPSEPQETHPTPTIARTLPRH